MQQCAVYQQACTNTSNAHSRLTKNREKLNLAKGDALKKAKDKSQEVSYIENQVIHYINTATHFTTYQAVNFSRAKFCEQNFCGIFLRVPFYSALILIAKCYLFGHLQKIFGRENYDIILCSKFCILQTLQLLGFRWQKIKCMLMDVTAQENSVGMPSKSTP